MALKLRIAAGECIVINGALIRAESKAEIVLMNRANFMVDRQIMRPEQANSPARRIYFSLQNAYLADPEERPRMREFFDTYTQQFFDATGSTTVRNAIAEMRERVAQNEFYTALQISRELIQYEDSVLQLATLAGSGAARTAAGGSGRGTPAKA
ncbi:MAG: flagellum biosynthesis repressor protein [Pseudomonadota bacterium]|jgi:flagellar protein FlbT